MAKNRSFHLLAVVTVALLGSALITQPTLAQSQSDPIFPLIGSPNDYLKGTEEIGGKGYHCDGTVTICGWDYWRPDKGPAVVLASINGTVTHCGDLDDVGNPVVVIENEAWQVGYLHMERIDLTCGTKVVSGQIIGLTGNIGRLSSWNHLHFWVKKLATGQFDENQSWPNVNAQPEARHQAQVLGLSTQDLGKIPQPVLIGIGIAVVFALGLANQRTRGVAALSLLIMLVTSFGWLVLHTKIEAVAANITMPSAVSDADSSLATRGGANTNGWEIIQQAVKDAGGDNNRAELLYWAWQSETAVVDCLPWEEKFGVDGLPNPCVSSVYAKGPFQFMDGTWARYEANGWDKWALYGATRGAYEEFTRLNLWDKPNSQSFAIRFSGQDGGQVWNQDSDGYNQALTIFNNWLRSNP